MNFKVYYRTSDAGGTLAYQTRLVEKLKKLKENSE